jgi:hypothetical protein
MNNCIKDSKKSLKAMYKRYLLDNHCVSKEELDAMTTPELRHEYNYWNVVLA